MIPLPIHEDIKYKHWKLWETHCTECTITITDYLHKTFIKGYSICSLKENFNKKKGRTIAFGRAFKAFQLYSKDKEELKKYIKKQKIRDISYLENEMDQVLYIFTVRFGGCKVSVMQVSNDNQEPFWVDCEGTNEC